MWKGWVGGRCGLAGGGRLYLPIGLFRVATYESKGASHT